MTEYLPGYQLIHEGLIDFYAPTAQSVDDAVQQVASSMLTKHLVYDGIGFRVYRRKQRPHSLLWDLEDAGTAQYHAL